MNFIKIIKLTVLYAFVLFFKEYALKLF